MKILHLLYSDGIAGAEKHLLHLLPAMKNEGINCHLIIVVSHKNKNRFDNYSIELTGLGIQNSIIMSSKIGFLRTAKKIKNYMDSNEFIHLHSHLSNSDLIATIIKLFFNPRLKTISTKHGYEEKFLEILPDVPDVNEQRKIARKSWFFYISKFMIDRCDHNFAVSKALSVLFHNIGLTKTQIPFIQHGIDIPKLDSNAGENHLRISPHQIVTVGRLENFKGHKYLIEAMVYIVKQFPLSKLLIIGSGSQKTNLEALATNLGVIENIKFLGFCSDPYSYVQNSDVAALPSLFEPFGLVYIEAFALGTPVVAFDTPAGNEILENNKTGLLVSPRDSKELSEKIIHLLSNPEEADLISKAAKNKYFEYYNAQRLAKDTANFYRNIG